MTHGPHRDASIRPNHAADRELFVHSEGKAPELRADEALREVLAAGLQRDWALAGLADRQWGNATRGQALATGMGPGAFDGRVQRGYLHRQHRGVYRVDHCAPLEFDREMAAVLACGTRALISHASAAYLWALAPRPPGDVHVTGPDRRATARGSPFTAVF
jgi:hypothetical protein